MTKSAKTTAQMVAELGKDTPKKSDPCPKCGSTGGWKGPHYVRAHEVVTYDRRHPSKVKKVVEKVGEHLAYVCLGCGFPKHVPTKDAK